MKSAHLPVPAAGDSAPEPRLDDLRARLVSPPAAPDRAARYARFTRHATTGQPPVLLAPSAPTPALLPVRDGRRQSRLLLGVIAILVLGLGLLWQQTTALQDEVAALRAAAQQATTREGQLTRSLDQEKAKLAGQNMQLRAGGAELQGVSRELQDLRDRMALLDQHNAELRDALGLGTPDGAAVPDSTTPSPTATPAPNGALPPAIGGESGPLYALTLLPPTPLPAATAGPDPGDLLDQVRADMAELSHRLDIEVVIEDNLTSYAADRLLEWGQMDEDDDTEAPPEVADLPDPPESGGGTDPPAKAPPAAIVAHVPKGLPHYGTISSLFGWRASPFVAKRVGFHKGLDIIARTGTPVTATQAGKVVQAGWSAVYGRLVMIDHGAGWVTLYGHNSKLAVKVGQWVTRGQVVAYSGSTGMSTGPHIHYEVRHNGVPVNPLKYK